MKNNEKNMTFLDHLSELRKHLIRSFSLVIIAMILFFFNKEFLFDTLILAPKSPNFITYKVLCKLSSLINLESLLCIKKPIFILMNVNMSGQFTTHIWISFIASIIFSFPYLVFELWLFIKPALTLNEKKSTSGIVFIISILFFIGVLFGYYLIVPLSINFLGNYQVSSLVANNINLSSYISIVSSITLSCGIIFQLPILVYFLSKFGIISSLFMKKYRSHFIIISLIFASIITPPDISSQILVTIPLLFLYEISIIVSKYVNE